MDDKRGGGMSIQVAIAPGDRVVPWINQCPPEWPLRPLKYAAKINARTLGENTASDFEISYIDISSVDANGRQTPAETMTFGDAPSRARRVVSNGEVIISTVRTYLKAINYIENGNDNLICSTGFAVITPSPQVHPKFLLYWVRSEWFVNEIVARSVGVSYPAINAIEIGNLPFPTIAVEEQQAIAKFLDRETARIDELIAKNRRLIKLLQEQRTALITRIVTKGLNPDVPMKDSGVEWLGGIPAHWEVKKLKYVVVTNPGAIKSGPFGSQILTSEMSGSDVKVYNQRNVVDQDFDAGENYITQAKYLELSSFTVYVGDILITTRGTIGRCAIVPQQAPLGILHPCLMRIQPDIKKILSNYLKIIIQDSTLFYSQLQYFSNATTIDVVYTDTLKNIKIPLPPPTEQLAIIDFLNQETARIDSLVDRINQAIEKLQEYRSALITAAVTGKIDVRQQVS